MHRSWCSRQAWSASQALPHRAPLCANCWTSARHASVRWQPLNGRKLYTAPLQRQVSHGVALCCQGAGASICMQVEYQGPICGTGGVQVSSGAADQRKLQPAFAHGHGSAPDIHDRQHHSGDVAASRHLTGWPWPRGCDPTALKAWLVHLTLGLISSCSNYCLATTRASQSHEALASKRSRLL